MTNIVNGPEHIEQTVLHISSMMDTEPDLLKRQEYRNLVKEALHELDNSNHTTTLPNS